jgi:hypothetical protein
MRSVIPHKENTLRKSLVLALAVLLSIVFFFACGHQNINMRENESPSPEYSVNMDGDDWNEFLKLKERYYYLDKQHFNKISCAIEVPLMANLIEQIKRQLGPLEKNIEIKENIKSFALTYNPKSGLNFSDPELDIILKSKEGINDPVKVEEGIGMMKNGFKMQIDGVKNIIKGLFDDYSYPKQEDYKDLVVTKKSETYIVKYFRGKNKYTETYSGNIIDVSQEGVTVNIKSKQNYVTTKDDKLIIEKGSASTNLPTGNMKMIFSIEYQDVEDIVFPKNIKVIFEQTMQSISQKGAFDIVLKNCQIK